jgi:hypothetical protein
MTSPATRKALPPPKNRRGEKELLMIIKEN